MAAGQHFPRSQPATLAASVPPPAETAAPAPVGAAANRAPSTAFSAARTRHRALRTTPRAGTAAGMAGAHRGAPATGGDAPPLNAPSLRRRSQCPTAGGGGGCSTHASSSPHPRASGGAVTVHHDITVPAAAHLPLGPRRHQTAPPPQPAPPQPSVQRRARARGRGTAAAATAAGSSIAPHQNAPTTSAWWRVTPRWRPARATESHALYRFRNIQRCHAAPPAAAAACDLRGSGRTAAGCGWADGERRAARRTRAKMVGRSECVLFI